MKDRYKTYNKMVFSAAIGFGNMSFNHPVQIQTCYLLTGFVMGAGITGGPSSIYG